MRFRAQIFCTLTSDHDWNKSPTEEFLKRYGPLLGTLNEISDRYSAEIDKAIEKERKEHADAK